MPNFICTTCGTRYAESDQPPVACSTCQDERQYVKKTGQQWTSLDKLRLTNRNSVKFKEPGLIGVGIDPHFAIGRRALFLYPNYIPLPASAVARIVRAVAPFSFDRIYGAFWDLVIEQDGKAVVRHSAERYLRAIGQ